MPVIFGASGRTKKGLDKNLPLLPGHPSAIELHKITLMSIAQSILIVLGVNRFDLLLRSGLNRRPPPNN